MCYPAPGPRCSAHASEQLHKKQANFVAKEKEFVDNARRFENIDDPEFTRANQRLLQEVSVANDEVSAAQAAYDSTPAGQKELKKSIAEATDEVQKKVLVQRLGTGVQVRAAQRKALGEAASPRLRTPELAKGDVLLGSGFTVTHAPYKSVGQPASKMWVEGYYPNETQPYRREWSRNTSYIVDREVSHLPAQEPATVESSTEPVF